MTGPNFFTTLATGKVYVFRRNSVLFHISGYNGNAATRWLQVFNQKADLAGGEVPVFQVPVGTLQQTGIGVDVFTKVGLTLSAGLIVAFSTTRGSYVAATDADHDIYVSAT